MAALDTITIASRGSDAFFDRIGEFEIVNDLTAPSEARFEVGDDGSWPDIQEAIAIGTRFEVSVNARPRMTGRLLARRNPITVDGGSTIQLTIRTRTADAAFASARPFNVSGATLRDIILKAYEPLGFTAADFIFRADVARDLITGRRRGGGRGGVEALLELREDQAKVAPPETIRDFVERHLNRFGLAHWDGPDGRIVVGAPDDEQQPRYVFRALRGLSVANNILDAEKIEDFEEVPTELTVFGQGAGAAVPRSKLFATEADPTLTAVSPTLYRIVSVQEDSIRTRGQAVARARREMSDRSRSKDAWRIRVDGLSYRDGSGPPENYAPDTVADVLVDAQGGATGAYLVYRTRMFGNAPDGLTTELDAVARGIWRLS